MSKFISKASSYFKCHECGCVGAHYCTGKSNKKSPMDVCAVPGDGPLLLTTIDKETLNELAELDKLNDDLINPEDGAEYSFFCNNKPWTGVYSKFRNALFTEKGGNKICGFGEASNIQIIKRAPKQEIITDTAEIERIMFGSNS